MSPIPLAGSAGCRLRSVCAAAIILAIPAGAGESLGRAPPDAGPSNLPAPPAFSTGSAWRVKEIGPGGFTFEPSAGPPLRIRLIEADTAAVTDRQRDFAETVARNLLQEKPVWVFPCGTGEDPAGPVGWARVWTDKGWLGEVLIRAGYAARRRRPEPDRLGPPPKVAHATGKGGPPGGAAYQATAVKPLSGTLFEVTCRGRARTVRLFDIAPLAPKGQPEAATAEAIAEATRRCTRGGPVWVFPCRAGRPGAVVPVRIWTAKGWLADALVARGLARRLADPLRPGAGSASGSDPAADPPKATTPPVREKPPATGGPAGTEKSPKVRWTPVALRAARVSRGTMPGVESAEFEVPYGVLRITWNCRPWKAGIKVVLNLYRIDESYSSRKVSSHHVATMKGDRGQRVFRVRPGRYWIKLSCSEEVEKVQVEIAEPPE